MKRAGLGCAAVLAACTVANQAGASGLYFSDRGVRPLGRGGAFVAGADDAGSITYNPAGLAFTGHQFLLDTAWLQYSSTYQRETLITSAAGESNIRRDPAVEGTSPILPIPTLVYANPLGTEDFNFALGVWAPYSAITSYPETVIDASGQRVPAPQRYSLLSLDGSALAITGLYASYQPDEVISFGAGVELLAGYFQTSVAFSACVPDRFICAPEQPDYDAYSELRVGMIAAPSGILGAILKPNDMFKFGASFHLPFWIDAPATVKVRLPSADPFEGAAQRGENANVKFQLPWVLRTGVEMTPLETTHIELGMAYEAWSMHDSIEVEPDGIALTNVAAFPPVYQVAPISIERRFQDSFSVRVGAEHGFEVGGYGLDARAGVMYEKSAIPNEYLSVTTVDLDKVTASIGGSLHVGAWRFDGVYARVFGMSTKVDPRRAAITQVNPVLANPPADPVRINGGSYSANANVFGIGLAYQFDYEEKPAAAATEPAEPPRPEPTAEPGPEAKPTDDSDGFDEAFEEKVGGE